MSQNNLDITLYTKKGTLRKRKPKQKINYFTDDTQDAIIEFTYSDDVLLRDRIYKDRIEYAFFKLTQNIIHTFKYYYTDGETIEDLQQEVISFLLEKLKLYNPDKGRAYSYFGTIAKRYLILKNKASYKKLQEKGSLDEVDDDKEVYNGIIQEEISDELIIFMDLYVEYMDKHLKRIFPKPIDYQTAGAIVELFRKRETIEIFNKKAIYIYIKELINVDTIQITKIIKKLKLIYIRLFNEFYENKGIIG